jgi:hypothetical protein
MMAIKIIIHGAVKPVSAEKARFEIIIVILQFYIPLPILS